MADKDAWRDKATNRLNDRIAALEAKLKAEQEQCACYLANWKATEKGYNEVEARRVNAEAKLAEAQKDAEPKVYEIPSEYWRAMAAWAKSMPIAGWKQDKSVDAAIDAAREGREV